MATKNTKSDKQVRYEAFRSDLIKGGLDKKIFPMTFGGVDIKSLDPKIRKIKEENPDLRIMLGDINFYAEQVLLCTSKKTLQKTHVVLATETRRYWCEQIGIDARVDSNQGKRLNVDGEEENVGWRKSYGINCLLTVDQTIQMFCYYLRLRLPDREKVPIRDLEDIGTVILLSFLEKCRKEVICALDDNSLSLGKTLSLPLVIA